MKENLRDIHKRLDEHKQENRTGYIFVDEVKPAADADVTPGMSMVNQTSPGMLRPRYRESPPG